MHKKRWFLPVLLVIMLFVGAYAPSPSATEEVSNTNGADICIEYDGDFAHSMISSTSTQSGPPSGDVKAVISGENSPMG